MSDILEHRCMTWGSSAITWWPPGVVVLQHHANVRENVDVMLNYDQNTPSNDALLVPYYRLLTCSNESG